MNQQKAPGGIEWTRIRNPDGTVRPGYTWNPVVGCMHECRWQMPDGSIAECYAKRIAEGVAKEAYPDGFFTIDRRPDRIAEPFTVKEPSGIFIGSQTDIMQRGFHDHEIKQIFDVVKGANWHTYFLLTKNAPRLWKFAADFPDNLWVGVSMPPTWMHGKRLTEQQQEKFLLTALKILDRLSIKVRWMSFEPLSFDVSAALYQHIKDSNRLPLEWAVIGAASNGAKKYQPAARHLHNLISLLNSREIPIFFKGNLKWHEWHANFPGSVWGPEHKTEQMRLF